MHLIGEASRLIAVEINLQSNSHHKQNYILLYRDESEQRCLLCGCPLCAAATLWAERQNPICYKLSINFGALKCLDEKFISVSHAHLVKNAEKQTSQKCKQTFFLFIRKKQVMKETNHMYIYLLKVNHFTLNTVNLDSLHINYKSYKRCCSLEGHDWQLRKSSDINVCKTS